MYKLKFTFINAEQLEVTFDNKKDALEIDKMKSDSRFVLFEDYGNNNNKIRVNMNNVIYYEIIKVEE